MSIVEVNIKPETEICRITLPVQCVPNESITDGNKEITIVIVVSIIAVLGNDIILSAEAHHKYPMMMLFVLHCSATKKRDCMQFVRVASKYTDHSYVDEGCTRQVRECRGSHDIKKPIH